MGEVEEPEEFEVDVIRDESGNSGFRLGFPPLSVDHIEDERLEELKPAEEGDLIIAVNGTTVTTYDEYVALAKGVSKYTLTLRGPEEKAFTKQQLEQGPVFEVSATKVSAKLGMWPTLPPGRVWVEDVAAGGWAQKAGITIGSEIITVNKEEAQLLNAASFMEMMEQRPLLLTIAPVLHLGDFEVVAGESTKSLGCSPNLPPGPVVITEIRPESWADEVGVQVGMHLLQANGVEVSDLDEDEFKELMVKRPLKLLFSLPESASEEIEELDPYAALGQPAPKWIKIIVVSADGLRNRDLGGGKSDPYCVCKVPGKKNLKLTTKTLKNTDCPRWDHMHEFSGEESPSFNHEDSLEFTVWDADVGKDDFLGRARLSHKQIFPKGFTGRIRLEGAGKSAKAYLNVQVQVPQGELPLPKSIGIRIMVVGARGLETRNKKDRSRADPFCLCEVPKKKELRFNTAAQEDTLAPIWNHEHDFHNFTPGDKLKFSVWDKKTDGEVQAKGREQIVNGDELLGSAEVPFLDLYPSGFNQELKLQGGKVRPEDPPSLRLKITIFELEPDPEVVSAQKLKATLRIQATQKGNKARQETALKKQLEHDQQRQVDVASKQKKEAEEKLRKKEAEQQAFLFGEEVGLEAERRKQAEAQQQRAELESPRSPRTIIDTDRPPIEGEPGVPAKVRIEVTVVSAQGLKQADRFGLSDPFCICRIVDKPDAKIETKVIGKTLDPIWNYSDAISGCSLDDKLEFLVYDKDQGSKEFLGKAILEPVQFHGWKGFDGSLSLQTEDGKDAKGSLRVKVNVKDEVLELVTVPRPSKLMVNPMLSRRDEKLDERRFKMLEKEVEKLKLELERERNQSEIGVVIVGASGLRKADVLDKSDPFCICEVVERPDLNKIKTQVIKNTLNPEWNHSGAIAGYMPTDRLEFSVWDKDASADDCLGRAVLEPAQFYPEGFEGELPLADAAGSTGALNVKVFWLDAKKVSKQIFAHHTAETQWVELQQLLTDATSKAKTHINDVRDLRDIVRELGAATGVSEVTVDTVSSQLAELQKTAETRLTQAKADMESEFVVGDFCECLVPLSFDTKDGHEPHDLPPGTTVQVVDVGPVRVQQVTDLKIRDDEGTEGHITVSKDDMWVAIPGGAHRDKRDQGTILEGDRIEMLSKLFLELPGSQGFKELVPGTYAEVLEHGARHSQQVRELCVRHDKDGIQDNEDDLTGWLTVKDKEMWVSVHGDRDRIDPEAARKAADLSQLKSNIERIAALLWDVKTQLEAMKAKLNSVERRMLGPMEDDSGDLWLCVSSVADREWRLQIQRELEAGDLHRKLLQDALDKRAEDQERLREQMDNMQRILLGQLQGNQDQKFEVGDRCMVLAAMMMRCESSDGEVLRQLPLDSVIEVMKVGHGGRLRIRDEKHVDGWVNSKSTTGELLLRRLRRPAEHARQQLEQLQETRAKEKKKEPAVPLEAAVFAANDVCEASGTVVLREQRELNSAVVKTLGIGSKVTVLEVGLGRRVHVRDDQGVQGWASVASASGKVLLTLVRRDRKT